MTLVRLNSRSCAPAGSYYNHVNPWMGLLRNELENNFGGTSVPAANIVETTDDYRIELSVPGFSRSDFRIQVENQVLSISGEPVSAADRKEESYVRHEFGRNAFKRSFRLSALVDSNTIQARYENGILEVIIPKAEEAKAKPARDIQVD